jgi:diguanylate cyclase (GGDEF)-like protein
MFWWMGRHYDKVKYLTIIDELTGVYNRRYLTDHFNKIASGTFSLSLVDINDFKHINDTYGHHMGDLVLQHISSILGTLVEQKDFVVRLGGDEFLVISRTVYLQSQRMEFEIDVSFPVSASVGTAMYPYHGTTLNELINIADKNMYQIKQIE